MLVYVLGRRRWRLIYDRIDIVLGMMLVVAVFALLRRREKPVQAGDWDGDCV